jgi:hypothetical protein
VLQFPNTAARRRGKGSKKRAGSDQSVDPMVAATAGVDISQLGTGTYGLQEDQAELSVGDPVIIRGNVEHSGKTGDVAEFGRDKHFVIVDLYNFGKHAFHASNVEYNEYADQEDYIDENQRMDKFNIAQPTPGGTNKQREAFLDARDRLFRQMQSASPGEKEAIRLKIAELEGRAQSQGIRIRESDDLNRSGYNAIKSLSDWAEKMRVMRELQKDIALMSDPEAKAAVQQRIGDLLKVGIKQGYVKEALSDKAMAVLRGIKSPPQATQPAAMDPAKQAEVDAWTRDVERNLAPKLKPQAAAKPRIDLNVPAPKTVQDILPNDLPTLQRRIKQLDELIQIKELIDRLFLKAQNVRGGIYPGLQSDIEDEEMYGVPTTDQEFASLKDKYTRDLTALQKFIAMKKAMYREGQETLSESTALVRLKQARQALSQQGQVNELAPSTNPGGGNYFQALASAWYNGTFDSGSLQKGIKSQQDVERLLQRGIVGPDGVTRKYAIDYNSNFDGVVISSDDYYEHSDYNKQGQEVDSRTGQKWGPNDYMEFSDDDLSEGLNEYAPGAGGGNDDGGEDPYGRPQPRHYNRSVDYFSQFEADHFDREDFDDATGVFKGYWGDDQIAYFKFDNPQRNGSDDPGMGWYYEPQNESVAEGQTDYQKRRQRERDVDAGKPVSRQPKNPQNDYFARRKKEKKHDMDEAISKKDLLSRLQKDLPKVNDPKNKDANPVVWTGPGKNDYGYTGYQGHGMPTDKQERDRIRADKKKGMAEGTPFDQCPSCGGPIVHVSMLGEKQDACYHKVRSRYKVWPSAYASGALVQCRKKGAANWGNSGKKK